MTMGFAKFDTGEYTLRIMLYSDEELIKAGKNCSPDASRGCDPMTKQHNAIKYELCKKEWRRRKRGSTEGG